MSKVASESQPPAYAPFAGNDGSVYPPQNPAYPAAPAGYANQPSYAQPYGTQMGVGNASTIVVAQPAISVIQVFREVPVRINCPHCHADVITSMRYESGTLTWIVCAVMFFFLGCFLGCCLIPFCVDACCDVVHTCPNCHQQVGRYNRLS